MFLDHKTLRKTLQSFDKTKVLSLVCNRNIHSICSTFIFTQILKKELFKYQIEFRNMEASVDFRFEHNGEEFCLSNDQGSPMLCSCLQRSTVGVCILYNAVKSMNILKIETLWPVAVCFSYYKLFANQHIYGPAEAMKEPADLENIKNRAQGPPVDRSRPLKDSVCEKCQETYRDIIFSIRMLNCKSDGVFFARRNRLEFLLGSSLFQCIKSDLKFIHEKKLFHPKSASADRKIGEFLAKRGISISAANEAYLGLDSQVKSLCTAAFGEYEKFVFKLGHDIEITSIEHAFLVLFYLYKEKNMYSYMCLDKRKLVDVEKATRFYQKIILLFKEATLSASRVEGVVIFTVKADDLSIDQISVVSEVLSPMFRIYLKYRDEAEQKVVQCYAIHKTHSILYSENVDFGNRELDQIERIGCNMVKIELGYLPLFIKSIVMY